MVVIYPWTQIRATVAVICTLACIWPRGAPADPPMMVFVVAGQSNAGFMAGEDIQVTVPEDTLIYIWNAACCAVPEVVGDSWMTLRAVNGKTIAPPGPGVTFARRIAAATKQRIGLIPCNLGGPIGRWQSEEILYSACMDRHLATNLSLSGFLFYQGEGDARSDSAALANPIPPQPFRWRVLFERFVTDWRSETRRDLPVIFVRIAHLAEILPDTWLESPMEYWKTVQSQQDSVSLAYTRLVDSEPATLRDAIHLDDESFHVIGNRMAEAYLEIQRQIDAAPNETGTNGPDMSDPLGESRP
ncbi:MAG: hypothetical protein HOM31_15080 [Gemmatimonadetes bacterium]|nr:hypothetical protein [Gemmatimonadota bacterium]